MKIQEFLHYFPDYLYSDEELTAARYLEYRGSRFLVDFGFSNAPCIVLELLESDDYEVGHA